MAETKTQRFLELRRSNSYVTLTCFYSITSSMITFSMFHPILPFYLRSILNCSDVSALDVRLDVDLNVTNEKSYTNTNASSCDNKTTIDEEVSTLIGVISGTGSIMMVISCIMSGFLIQRFSIRVNLILSVILNLMCPALAFFAKDVVTMCFANGFISAGQTYSFVAYAAVFSEYSTTDRELTKFMGLYRVFNSLGFILGYSAASASYQFLGHKLTYIICFVMVFLDIFVRFSIVSKEKIIEQPIDDLMVDNKAEESSPEQSSSNIWTVLLNPYIILTSFQLMITFIGVSIFWGTAPNFVAAELGAEQWQTGLMMGIGTSLNLGFQLFLALTITSQKRRLIGLAVGYILFVIGYIWYPFAATVWTALPPDAFLRISKDMISLLLSTMYPYICNCLELENTKFIYGLCATSGSIGILTGYYISGVMVVFIGFRNLYITLGVLSAVLAVSAAVFIGVKPKDKPIDEPITLSLADLTKRELGLTELAASRFSLGRSNLSLHSRHSAMRSHPNSPAVLRIPHV